ncbi:hypothetical protein ACP70R_008233 [Stipagrostis hirtigluma subsp. patula]
MSVRKEDAEMEKSVVAGLQIGKEEESVTAGRVEDRASSPSSVVEMEKITTGINPSTSERVILKTSIIGRVPQWIKRVATSLASQRLKHGKPEEEEEEEDEEEASSSSWKQMVQEVNMLEKALIEKKGKAKNDPPGSWSTFSFSVELLKRLKSISPYVQKAHRSAGKESIALEEKDDSSSWVVQMEKILEHTNPYVKKERWKTPSIYRVPEWLKSTTKSQAYRPQVVSLGPFHHGDPKLKPMEEHKCRLMLHMVKRSEKPLGEFVEAVKAIADELQHAYDGLDERWRGANTSRFVQMMVTDGAFLLEIMTAVREMPDDYDAVDDPVFSIRGRLSLMPRIRSDMCLVENQLPLLLLQTLEAVLRGTSPVQICTETNKLVAGFLCPGFVKDISLVKAISLEEVIGNPEHPLDIYHKCFCGLSRTAGHHPVSDNNKCESALYSAVELREAGVHIRKSDTLSIQDINFQNDILSIPPVEVKNGTEKIILNLIAFEQLHSNAGTHVTDYMIFMDNIIDSEKDVALLRSKGVLKNFLSSDKEAAKLFNTLCTGATLNPISKVGHVQWMVAANCSKPSNKWRAIFVHSYLSNPWVFISLMTAVIVLALTVLQTVYTVADFYKKG